MNISKLIFNKYSSNKKFTGSTKNLTKLYFMSDPYLDELFYKTKIDKKIFIQSIKNKKGTEMENFTICKYNGILIGLIIYMNSENFFNSNLKNQFILYKMVNKNKKELLINHFRKNNLINKNNLKKDCIYVSKISVSTNFQSKGIATQLLHHLIKSKKKDIYLHVKKK